MQRIDRKNLSYHLHSVLHFSPKRIPGVRGLAEVADPRAVNALLETILDLIYKDGAIIVRPDAVSMGLTGELGFGIVRTRPGVFGEDEPHPCPDKPPFRPIGG